MSTKHADPVTVEQVIALIAKARQEEQTRIDIHDALGRVLAKWEGKKLNKRIVDQLRIELGYPLGADSGPVVHWSVEHGSAKITIWGKASPWASYSDSPSFYVASNGIMGTRDEIGAFKLEYFEHHDIANGHAAKRRNLERDRLLADKGLLQAFADTATMQRELRSTLDKMLEFDGPLNVDGYALERLAGLRDG